MRCNAKKIVAIFVLPAIVYPIGSNHAAVKTKGKK